MSAGTATGGGVIPLLDAVLDAIEVTSDHSFRWFGARIEAEPAAGEWPAAALLRTLSDHLYAHVAVSGWPVPADRPGRSLPSVAVTPDTDQTTALPGWTVSSRFPGSVVLRRRGLAVLARTGEVRSREGGDAEVLVPASAPWPPGFIMTGHHEPSGPLVRVYWNPCGSAREALVGRLAAELRATGVAFRIKVLEDDAARARADAVVTYLPRAGWDAAWAAVGTTWSAFGDALRPQTPAFTRRLAPGLAFADDPGSGDSFGAHRMGVLAEGLLGAAAEPRRRGRLEVVLGTMRRAGVDPGAPHLAPGGADPAIPRLRARRRASASPSDAIDMLIERIHRTAVVGGDRATWLAADTTAAPSEWRVATTMGGDLYEGTAGPALVLAEHAARTGAESSARLARSAALHALASGAAGGERYGLFDGAGGVAVACGRVASLIGDARLASYAARVAGDLTAAASPLPAPDLLGGRAGVVMAALAVERCFGAEAALRVAGRHLAGLEAERPGLTGLAHGVSGVALALAELWSRTGDGRALESALAGVAREDGLLDERGRWPDLRGQPGLPVPTRRTHATAWCHGAPGIALARLRLWELTGDDRHRATARAAFGGFLPALDAMARAPGPDLSLCHGLAGLGEVALEGSRVLGDEALSGAARRAAGAIARIVGSGDPVPCGTPHGETPGLMLGLSGVARFLMRIDDDRIPGLLILRPEEWEGAAVVTAGTGTRHDDTDRGGNGD